MPDKIFQAIVGLEPVSNGHRLTWLEVLACGHTGQSRATRQAVEQAITQGRRRVCFRCTHGR